MENESRVRLNQRLNNETRDNGFGKCFSIMPDHKAQSSFRSNTMRIGFIVMALSIAWAILSFVIDLAQIFDFSWFSASGAVMVSGSILFERLKPGTGLDGGSSFNSLPTLGQEINYLDSWLMKHGGKLSITILILGTLIWAYGSLVV